MFTTCTVYGFVTELDHSTMHLAFNCCFITFKLNVVGPSKLRSSQAFTGNVTIRHNTDSPLSNCFNYDLLCGEPLWDSPLCGEPLCGESLCGEPLWDEPLCGEPLCGEPLSDEQLWGEPLWGESLVIPFTELTLTFLIEQTNVNVLP